MEMVVVPLLAPFALLAAAIHREAREDQRQQDILNNGKPSEQELAAINHKAAAKKEKALAKHSRRSNALQIRYHEQKFGKFEDRQRRADEKLSLQLSKTAGQQREATSKAEERASKNYARLNGETQYLKKGIAKKQAGQSQNTQSQDTQLQIEQPRQPPQTQQSTPPAPDRLAGGFQQVNPTTKVGNTDGSGDDCNDRSTMKPFKRRLEELEEAQPEVESQLIFTSSNEGTRRSFDFKHIKLRT